jgi:hypothetical protein
VGRAAVGVFLAEGDYGLVGGTPVQFAERLSVTTRRQSLPVFFKEETGQAQRGSRVTLAEVGKDMCELLGEHHLVRGGGL